MNTLDMYNEAAMKAYKGLLDAEAKKNQQLWDYFKQHGFNIQGTTPKDPLHADAPRFPDHVRAGKRAIELA